ncbi:MAG: phosphatase PAP2 family protein [Prevotella sp.]|nr:phosphatase PAP2 family protein [Prevotella sp.]
MIFTPFYLPLVGIALLFTLSYMSMLPFQYKLFVVTVVYLLTILVPTFLIHLYRRYRRWSLLQIGHKRRRMVPYVISMMCYLACIWFMESRQIFHFIVVIVLAALIIQAVSLIVNFWWKVSTHTAAIGGVTGALMAFAELFRFNPVWWLCLALFLSGILGTARIILRQHTPGQVVAGFAIGVVSAFITIIYL